MKLPNNIKAHVRSPENNEFRSGWLEGEHIVVAFMTPEFADMLGKLFIQRAAIAATPADEPAWVRAGIDLFSSAARASFLESPIHLVPVPNVDLPKSCADLDRHDQANVTPPETATETGQLDNVLSPEARAAELLMAFDPLNEGGDPLAQLDEERVAELAGMVAQQAPSVATAVCRCAFCEFIRNRSAQQ